MDARILSNCAGAISFPILMDATLPAVFDPAQRGFKTARVDSMTVAWILLPLEIKGQWSPDLATATGPSEATVLPIAFDVTGDGGNGLVALEAASQTVDETSFVRVASQIEWSQRPAADFVRAVHLALTAGAHLLARNLATQGARLYPESLELGKMALVLAPPRVVRASLPPDPSLRANLEWMRAHAAEYRGQWVALKGGILLASAPTARGLREQLPATDGLFLTRVV